MSDDEAEVVCLLGEAVPEVATGVVVVKAITRDRGYRSKLALTSADPRVDAVAQCVGRTRLSDHAGVQSVGWRADWPDSLE